MDVVGNVTIHLHKVKPVAAEVTRRGSFDAQIHLLTSVATAPQTKTPAFLTNAGAIGYRLKRLFLLHRFNLRNRQDFLAVLFGQNTCRGDLFRLFANVIVEILALVIFGKVIRDLFAVFFRRDRVLAFLGFVQRAFGALAQAGDRNFFIGRKRRNRQQTRERNNSGDFFHTLFNLFLRGRFNITRFPQIFKKKKSFE